MKNALGWVVVAVTVIFVLFNLQSASVSFPGLRVEMPLAFVMIASALLGALATYAFTNLKNRSRKDS
jgi:uncharacterized integral membrane protein